MLIKILLIIIVIELGVIAWNTRKEKVKELSGNNVMDKINLGLSERKERAPF